MKIMNLFHSPIKIGLIPLLMMILSFSSAALSQEALPEWVTGPVVTPAGGWAGLPVLRLRT